MVEQELLQKIGLTDSESKVYLALLKIGEFTSKGAILKRAKIAPSKVYHVLDKLIDKGMVSTVTKNNVKHFAAAPPSRINDYIDSKKQDVAREEKTAERLLPQLEGLYKSFKEKTAAEVFMGWQGMETVYSTIYRETKKRQTIYVLGASAGEMPEKAKRFYYKHGIKMHSKGNKVKLIFNENARAYAEEVERQSKIRYDKKFLFKTSPVEILITEGITAIVMLKEEPIVILVRDRETSESFVTYFNELWKIAKR